MKMKRLLPILIGIAPITALSAPLFPTILGHDWNFGAFNGDGTAEWSTNGTAPDTLIYTALPIDTEVTAYWPFWPVPPVFPVFNLAGGFGGDFVMGVEFTGQDAPYVGPGGTIDVSLTGTGLDPAGPDLLIFGAVPALGMAGLLWAIDLDVVSLYGYAGLPTYVVEGGGIIVDGIAALQFNLIGKPGVVRGHLDFIDAPPGWIPPMYHPLESDYEARIRAAYSGETGYGTVIPEPATLVAVGFGLISLLKARRNKTQ